MTTDRRRASLKWTLLAIAALLLSALAAVAAAAVAAQQFRSSDLIASNVRIQGVPVGGMNSAEAARAVLDHWAASLPQTITLRWSDGEMAFSPDELGLALRVAPSVSQARRLGREGTLANQWKERLRTARKGADIPVQVDLDRSSIESCLAGIAPQVHRKPKNADITVSGKTVNVVPGRTGVELDIPGSIDAVAKALADPRTDAVDLVTKLQHPAIRTEDLQHLQVVLGSYTTKFRAHQTDRTHNLRLAINNLGRAVVAPGETLSFNRRVGPRLSEKGWREAPIFIDGEVEPSTGGGICQVASTVYNAALLANLDILERHHHSRPVDYVPAGMDATVYWGQYDLKLRNQLTHPILILGDITDTTLTVRVLGHRADDYDVEVVRSGEQTIPFATKEQPDPELEEGKTEQEKPGRRGKRVTVTRIVHRNGEEVARERLHTDTYSPQTRIMRVGTKPPEEPEPLETPEGVLPGQVPPGTQGVTPMPQPSPEPAAPSPASPTPGTAGLQPGPSSTPPRPQRPAPAP